MSEHQTFSLNTILTSRQIKPEVYKHIIRQIKSPLQQQSFQLTNDDSKNSYTIQKIPKRPSIPPPPSKRHRIHFQNYQFSRTYQSFSDDLQNGQAKYRQDNNSYAVQSFVAPLQYEANSKQHLQNNFCGAFDSILQIDDRSQVLQPTNSRNGKRKPIFQKKKLSKPLKTLDQAVSKLKSINQNQFVFFLQLMRELQKHLSKIFQDKNTMQAQLRHIFQRLALETHYIPTAIQSNQAYSKILQRIRSKNSGEVVKKLFKRGNQSQKVRQAHLQKLFIGFSNLQSTFNCFLNKKQSIQKLTQAFAFLMQNFQKEVSFKAQLNRFYENLSIEISTNGLQLIWQNCANRKLTIVEFMQGLYLNHFIMTQKQGFEDILLQKGFMRNEQ